MCTRLLRAAAASADTLYNGVNAADVSVTNTDSTSPVVTVLGTAGNDTITFRQVGNDLQVTVNGVVQHYDATVVTTINLNGLGQAVGGTDAVNLYDTTGTDHFEVGPTHSILTLSTGVTVVTSGFEVTKGYATGGTNVPGQQDTAVLYGTSSNDKFYGYDTTGYILASQVGLSYYTYSFGSVEARVNVADAATGGAMGGTDIANLYDAVGSDTLYVGPLAGRMEYSSGKVEQATGFYSVYTRATAVRYRYGHGPGLSVWFRQQR